MFKKVFGQNQRLNLFVWGMRIFVIYLNVMPLYLVNYEILEFFENEMDKTITKYLFNIVMVLNIISYLRASWRKPKQIP